MKKSDAARKLYYLVRNAQSHSSDPLKNMLVLLDDIEKELGMLPPDYMSPTGCPCGEPECTEQGIVNEWEEEDKDESGS